MHKIDIDALFNNEAIKIKNTYRHIPKYDIITVTYLTVKITKTNLIYLETYKYTKISLSDFLMTIIISLIFGKHLKRKKHLMKYPVHYLSVENVFIK